MSGLADIVRGAVAIADTVTSTLQVAVTHLAWTGQDAYEKPSYNTPGISRLCILEMSRKMVRGPEGRDVEQTAMLTFPYPIDPQGSAHRREPIDPRDKFVLPDGRTAPVLSVDGIVDPATDQPYMYQVSLG